MSTFSNEWYAQLHSAHLDEQFLQFSGLGFVVKPYSINQSLSHFV